MVPVAHIVWTRAALDGHDACVLFQRDSGWLLRGAAVFVHDGQPCCLRYEVACDNGWRATAADIDGWIGADDCRARVERDDDGGWLLNGVPQRAANGGDDIDLAFTPATNIAPLRRYATAGLETMPAPAAYLSIGAGELTLLEQTYRRLDASRFAYTAATFDYATTLVVHETGFVTHYPGLWSGRVTTLPR